jgi:hypothetical protein
VDREAQMRCFCEMLDTGEKPILAVWGGGGSGKSITDGAHGSRVRASRPSQGRGGVDRYAPPRLPAALRKIRDDVGVDHFGSFTDLVNYFTVPQYNLQISVSSQSS